MRPRVLMIGPSEGALGGIASLVETLLPSLSAQIDLEYLATAPADRPSMEGGKVTFRNLGSAVSQLYRFIVAVLRYRPQIIHLHTSQGIAWLKDSLFVLLAKGMGKRVVVHVHASTFEELYGTRSASERRYTRMVLRIADVLIAVSETWRRRLGEITAIHKVHTFINCVDSNTTSVAHREGGSDPIRAVFLGSIGERKGVLDLIAAAQIAHNHGVRMVIDIAGYEDAEGFLDRMNDTIERAGLQEQVRFIGAVHGEEKLSLLARSSIFVLPSYNEGLPIALLEAMAAGCAVITTPVGGIPEVITDGQNGFLVDPGDVQSIANRLQILAEDGLLRRSMSERNRARAEKELDVGSYVTRLVAFYEQLNSDGPRRTSRVS